MDRARRAHVLRHELDDGRVVHRSSFGNYLDRAAAERARAEIAETTGMEGYVRRMW